MFNRLRMLMLHLIWFLSLVFFISGCGDLFDFSTPETPDTTPPTVSPTSPVNNATDVAVNTAITATFSEPMDASTITTATFTVGGVTGIVTYSGTTATFTPSANLAYNTTYTATITTGVKDAAGNAMASNYTWSFTTEALKTFSFIYHTTPDSHYYNVGTYNSIASFGSTYYISYYNSTSQSLYVTSTPDNGLSFNPSLGKLIASPSGGEKVGEYSFLAINPTTGQLHIAYYHEGVGLMYATAPITGPWSITTVDPGVVIENGEDTWNETTALAGVILSTAGDAILGASASFTIAADANGDGNPTDPVPLIIGTEAIPAMDLSDLSNAASISLWVRSSVALDSGDFQLLLDNTPGCVSPLRTFNIPALSANTWTLITFDLGVPSDLTSVISIGLRMAVDKGAMTLLIDHVHLPVGKYTSIALDSNGKVHISYYDQTNTALKYATNAGGGWNFKTVDTGLSGDNPGQYTSIKVDSNGKVHISYYDYHSSTGNGNLKYVKGSVDGSGNWTTIKGPFTLDSTGDTGQYSSLYLYDVDSDGTQEVVIIYNHLYIAGPNSYRRFARIIDNASGTWVHNDIVEVSDLTANPIVFDSNGILHMCYYSSGIPYHRSAIYSGTTWNWSNPSVVDDSGVGDGMYVSIVIGPDGLPRVSYYDATDGDLKFAHPQ